jgi:hypothetical protein
MPEGCKLQDLHPALVSRQALRIPSCLLITYRGSSARLGSQADATC